MDFSLFEKIWRCFSLLETWEAKDAGTEPVNSMIRKFWSETADQHLQITEFTFRLEPLSQHFFFSPEFLGKLRWLPLDSLTLGATCQEVRRRVERRSERECHFIQGITRSNVGMDQYLLIPFLGGWTSIYQLFWCSPGVQGFDTLPCGQTKLDAAVMCLNDPAGGFRTELDRTVLDVLDRPPADVYPEHQGLSCGHGFWNPQDAFTRACRVGFSMLQKGAGGSWQQRAHSVRTTSPSHFGVAKLKLAPLVVDKNRWFFVSFLIACPYSQTPCLHGFDSAASGCSPSFFVFFPAIARLIRVSTSTLPHPALNLLSLVFFGHYAIFKFFFYCFLMFFA